MKSIINKKIFIILFIAIIILFIGNFKIIEDFEDVRSVIESMGMAKNIEDSKYILMEDSDDISKVLYSLQFNYIEYKTKEYNIFELILHHDKDYRKVISNLADINDGKLVYSINHSKLINQKWNEKEWIWDYYYVFIDGNKICLEKYNNNNTFDYSKTVSGYVVYNIDDKTIVESEKVNYYKENYAIVNNWIFSEKSWRNPDRVVQYLLTDNTYCECNGLKYDQHYAGFYNAMYDEPMGVPLVFKISDLPQNNKALYEEFPYLLEAKSDEAMQDYYVILIFPYSMNADEVVELITEEDHTVSYDGVFVDEEHSRDGKMHYVNNFDEFMEYIDVNE